MALALLKLVVPTSSLYTSTRLPSQSCASSQSAASINHDRALRTVRCISLSQTCDQTIVRRTANYKPPIWDYDSLQSLNSKYVGDIYVKGAEKLKEEVKRMLAEVVDPLGGLEMIDDLQRLGVFYHFEDEIKRGLDNIRNDDKWNNEDLHSTALQFRLLRQHGYNIPQVKLDSNNFIVWKNQWHNILGATNLLSYIDGSIASPSDVIKDVAGIDVLNPDLHQWQIIDAHLLSCVTATLSSSIFTSVCQFKTSHEVWSTLEKRFTSLSRSHIHQLKNKLHSVVKASNSMEDYLSQIKVIADQLSLAGSAIDDEDLVLLTLNGLPSEYNAFKTTIRARSESVSMEVLSSLLCSEAIHVESAAKVSADLYVAYAAPSGSQSHMKFSSHNSSGSRGYNRGYNRGSYRGRSSSQKSTRGGRFGSGTVTCQICGKFNHTALNCWYRMDSSYQSANSKPLIGSPASSKFQNKAYVASAANSSDNRFLDSAATSHVTNDLQNLNLYQPYSGNEQVLVGDGNSFPIHHKGQD
ncbi:unnamed protein product [Camellia sinensis]